MGRLAGGLWLLWGCEGGEKDSAEEAVFGEEFLWGASTAGFQVEAGCPTIAAEQCEDRASDWYQWVTDPDLIADPGTYLSGQPLSDGPGHYELYEADLGRAQELGLGGLRVSIEWSRLFPDGAAEAATTAEELASYADPAAVSYYHAYFDAIAAAGRGRGRWLRRRGRWRAAWWGGRRSTRTGSGLGSCWIFGIRTSRRAARSTGTWTG